MVMHLDAEKEMMSQRVALLGKLFAVLEPNLISWHGKYMICRYVAVILHSIDKAGFLLKMTYGIVWFSLSPTMRYVSYIDVEIQQRAVEYITMSREGTALVYALAQMPKFSECQKGSIAPAGPGEQKDQCNGSYTPVAAGLLALATVDDQPNSVQRSPFLRRHAVVAAKVLAGCLASQAAYDVLFVNYRLTPKHHLPAAYEGD
ncbi:hypothetical protein Cni_G14960 [Canna indica]|uniref:Uncharacterized protein n=1 Tax=Canna indica TaxID=4628 RepID=A0AAQ3KCG2_9LILI|nr:hypothetical protein Cni_G14960 [Canna indica]